MELYNTTASMCSELLTKRFSTSFSMASRLFPRSIRGDIYNIYGLVRIADEIVDTYTGTDKRELLDALEKETYRTLKTGYSPNIMVHAFAQTARGYNIQKALIAPFFESMRMDIDPQLYTSSRYKAYIHGSAEVIGLMCLRVFCDGDEALYTKLAPGAQALGSAFQKVNFLRDMAEDYRSLGRVYFPDITFETFTDAEKQTIIEDIQQDFAKAHTATKQLPRTAQPSVFLATQYYERLLHKLAVTPAKTIQQQRVRVANGYKIWLLVRALIAKYTGV